MVLRETLGKLAPVYLLLGFVWVTGDVRLLLGIFAVIIAGFIWVIGNSKSQGWHDKRGIFKKCVNSQAVYLLSEQHGLEAQERR